MTRLSCRRHPAADRRAGRHEHVSPVGNGVIQGSAKAIALTVDLGAQFLVQSRLKFRPPPHRDGLVPQARILRGRQFPSRGDPAADGENDDEKGCGQSMPFHKNHPLSFVCYRPKQGRGFIGTGRRLSAFKRVSAAATSINRARFFIIAIRTILSYPRFPELVTSCGRSS